MGAVQAEGGKLEKLKTESLGKKVSFSRLIKVTAIGGEIKNGGILKGWGQSAKLGLCML